MSREVTVRLPAATGGRRRGRRVGARVAPGASAATRAPPPEKVPRVARMLALAHRWNGLIRSGAVRDQAALAALVGVSRARITQVMDLLRLAPDIQDEILFLEGGRAGGGLRHRDLLPIAALPLWRDQRWVWEALRPVARREKP